MEPKLLKNIEFRIPIIIFLISLLSLFIISSATQTAAEAVSFYYAKRQLIWILAGTIAMITMMLVDYHTLAHWSPFIYGINLLFLLLVIFVGAEGGGAQRWIDIGPFRFQPSEFAKVFIIITAANVMTKSKGFETIMDLAPIAAYFAIPTLLVAKQPDLGTALILVAIMFGMLFIAGINFKLLGWIVGAGVLSLPILWQFLDDYQKKRLIVFVNPYADPLGDGYNVIQSKITVGSGKFWGKGLFQGPQNKLDFLPAKHTDFIFAVIGEELGFVGGVTLILLFALLLYYTLRVAYNARDLLGTYMVVGIATMWTVQILVNIGMNIGLMPVTGIPLPFVSYGGSAFIINMMAAGLVLNVGMRRKKILF